MLNITVLRGSPKPKNSNTMQYFHFIRNHFGEHHYEIFNVCSNINSLEDDSGLFDDLLNKLEKSDLILWVYPVFYFLVPSPVKRFIELLFKKEAGKILRGKYASAITTSMHLFDHTSHNYIHSISEDLGLKYVEGFSAQFNDLINLNSRRNLLLFAENLFKTAENRVPVAPQYPRIQYNEKRFVPESLTPVSKTKSHRILMLTDEQPGDENLRQMTNVFKNSITNEVEVINLYEIYLKHGCKSCLQCTYDGICVTDDDMNRIYREKIMKADAIVYCGTIRDRYLSWRWKMFFDRFFVNAHRPVLKGKQGGFIISGPLKEIPNLRQLYTSFSETFGLNNLGFYTDEHSDDRSITRSIQFFAQQLVWAIDNQYAKPVSFLGVGGHLLLRDLNFLARFVFVENYKYYKQHKLLDFPQKQLKMRLVGLIIPVLLKMPGFRKKYLRNLNATMTKPLISASKKA